MRSKSPSRRTATKKQLNAKQRGPEKADSAKTQDRRRIAVGALLTFYRHLREISRKQMSDDIEVSISLLGMIENSARLPSQEVLEKMGSRLGLNTYQRLQLHAIAGYSAQLPEAPGWEVRADDVIVGVPLFLRNMQLEHKFQSNLDIDEAWVVTRRPLALEEPVLTMLRNNLLNTDANFVYFVDARFGRHDFETVWHRLGLESHEKWQKKRKVRLASGKPEQLTFVLSPPPLCAPTHTLALFNPRSATKPRFGRAAYYGGGAPIGVYALDRVLYEQVVALLKEVYVDCEANPNQPFPKDPMLMGTFELLTPPISE